jgi:hypothetical protein
MKHTAWDVTVIQQKVLICSTDILLIFEGCKMTQYLGLTNVQSHLAALSLTRTGKL